MTTNNKFLIWIAVRNLMVRKKRSGLSFMTIMSIMGVTLGVAALVIVLSVMGGFEADLKTRLLKGQPHIEIMHKQNAAGFGLKQHPISEIEKIFPEATQVQAFTQADVVLKQQRHMASAVLFGVDPSRPEHLWGFSGSVIDGDLTQLTKMQKPILGDGQSEFPGIALGDELARQLGAEIGDVITVLSPQARAESALSGGTVARQFVLAARFQTGMFNYDGKWAVVAIPEGRKFLADYDQSLDEDEYVSGVAFNVRDPMAVEELETRFHKLVAEGAAEKTGSIAAGTPRDGTSGGDAAPFADLDLLTWKKVNKSLLFALKLEKFAMGSILMLIVVVAAFSISSTMMMMVFHKRGQVSLLRSIGLSRGDISRIYVSHGLLIGTVGIFFGFVLGLGVCALISSFQFIALPEGIYHLSKMPVKWLWSDYGVIAVFAWIFSLAASLYPAVTAARQDPGIGLRHG